MSDEFEPDASGVTEATLFLRGPVNGEVKGPQTFYLLWNHTENLIVSEPEYEKAFREWRSGVARLGAAVTRGAPQAEQDALRKKLDAAIDVLDKWKDPAHIYNPAYDLEKLPRVLFESLEVEGPIQKEWPPPSHRAILFDGDDRRDAEYVREVFTRFLPRAYRRPVTKAEVEGCVAIVTDAQ